ncbi:serine/threonine-protein kinase, partial [Vannielia sp.]|uniref:serine/threonine-protein kinase n=1 Tax=Vannielia sp. TaxID=2813045 RepID=UPI00260269A2
MASDDNQSPKPDSQKTVISSVAPTGVAIGTQIMGTFEITEHIATGGMGEVYRGFNIHTEEPVAIKIVLAALAHDEKILSLFQKEATVLGRLHHDAIVRYMLFTVDPGIQRACLVMEFVEGRSLADFYAEEGKMPCEDVKTMMRRVASGLQKAHDLGVVHRDLSPDNVVIQDGLISHTKIIDFGIAKSANFGGGTLLGGQFAGKYGYVSPEQLGRFKGVIEGTSDIYSLALVAAAACRGEPVDMGDSPAEAVERRMDVPDLSGVHDELRPLLERMLQPDPKDRPQSMQDVLHLIDNPALLSGAAGAAPAAGAPVPPQGSVPPQYSVPPQGSVPPQYSVPPQGSVPPQYSVPPQGSVPPQYSVPPSQFTTPPGGGETVISTPPGFTPTQPPAVDMGGESPFPAQQTGVGRTLPPQAAPGMTMPPQQAEPAKKGKGGLIAALLALVVIGGGGAGAYFGGFIPGVGPGDDPVTEPGDGVIAGNETSPSTDPANNGSTGADTDAPDGDTIDFGDTSRPVTPDTDMPGTDTAGSETPDSETPDTTPDSDAPDTDTASTDTPDNDTPDSDTPDPDTRLASLDGGRVEPVDGTINPGEGTTMAS